MKKVFTILVAFGILIPSFFVFAFSTNDPYLNQQWYIDSLNLNQVWDVTQGYNVVIAVLDSGVDTDHPDLVNRIKINQKEIGGDGIDNDDNGFIDDIKGWDFIDNDNNPQPHTNLQCLQSGECDIDAFDHGTFVSGIIAAEGDNGLGVSGIAPKAKIMPLRVLDDVGVGDTTTVAKAVRYAVDNGANIINMSFSGLYDETGLDNALEHAFNNNVAVVVAAGNAEIDGFPINLNLNPRYPVCSTSKYGKKLSFGIGSHNQLYVLSNFSNRGKCLDILAPGENIFGLSVNNPELNLNTYYKNKSQGTSYASPMVSGAFALLKGYRSNITAQQMYNLVYNSAKNIDNISIVNQLESGNYGGGALDILNAINHVDDAIYLNTNSVNNNDNLIKLNNSSTVYYVLNSKLYTFLDEKTYFSWFKDFTSVRTVTNSELAKYEFGGVVTMRPGVSLIKLRSIPKVYAVSGKNIIRWIKTEDLAKYYYGDNWSKIVNEIPTSFYSAYTMGADIELPLDFDPTQQSLVYGTINDIF